MNESRKALEQIAEMLTIQTEIMVEEHKPKVASNLSMHAGQVRKDVRCPSDGKKGLRCAWRVGWRCWAAARWT
jgi:hypothetical protein